jgi:hypothetical protein
MQFLVFLLLLLLLFISPITHADTSSTEKVDEPPPSIHALEDYNRHRDVIAENVIRFANWVDNFFADDRIYVEGQRSYIKLNLLKTYFENDKALYDTQIKARLDIPKTQKRMQLFIESIDEDEDDTEQTTIDQTAEKQEQSIGLQFLRPDSRLWKITAITGVRFRSGLDPFARLRFRRLIKDGAWSYRITENIFWYSSDGAGETTQLDIDHPLTKKLLFRATTKATWRKTTHYFDLGQDLTLFQRINSFKSFAYQTGYRATMVSHPSTTNYYYSVRYRQQIHSNWLYVDVIPTIHHPEENNFKPIRSITLKLEIVFDAK